MIVTFFKGKYESEDDGLIYLEGGTKTRKTPPVLLKGNPTLTREYLKIASKFSRPYTYGCLGFEEKDIRIEQKLILMDEFERVLLAGLDSDQYDIVWIEHKDKGGVELNFHIVNMELTTQKSLTPYVHRRDLYRIDSWKNLVNDKFGFTNPNDPSKKRSFTLGNNSKPRVELMAQIDNYIVDLALDGELNSQDDIINSLNSIDGITVTRITKSAISFKAEGYQKPIRLKGEFYGQNFGGIDDLEQQQEERIRRFETERNQRVKDNKRKLAESFKRIVQQRRTQYPKFVPKAKASELVVPDSAKPNYVVSRVRGDLVFNDKQHQPISKVPSGSQKQRHRGDLLPNQNNQNQKINNDVNNNHPQYEIVEHWVQKLINSIKSAIIRIGDRIVELCGVNKKIEGAAPDLSVCISNVRENAVKIDRIIRGAGPKITHNPKISRLHP